MRNRINTSACVARIDFSCSADDLRTTAVKDTHTHTHPFNGPLSRTTWVSRYQKIKPIWILLKQETVSGSGISWAVCKSVPRFRQITTPAPHHSVFYRPDALPAAQPTASYSTEVHRSSHSCQRRREIRHGKCRVSGCFSTLITARPSRESYASYTPHSHSHRLPFPSFQDRLA